MIAAETGAVIAAVVAVGGAVADVHAAGAHKVLQAAGAIYLPRNMLLPKAASPADMTIVADNRAVMTIGAQKLHGSLHLPLLLLPRTRSFFQVNRSQNIAASQPLRLRPFPVLSMKLTNSRTLSKRLRPAPLAICRPPLRAAAAFLAGSLAACLAGC
jgi:hypothetical protein